MPNPLDQIAGSWGVTPLKQVADTGHAVVWKTATEGGQPRALKLYHRTDRGNEAAGTRLLQAWRDRGAVRVRAETESAVLMDWLDGPSLGDAARGGDPDRALELLAKTARRLHQPPQRTVPGLTPLIEVFAPLFSANFSETCPAPFRQDIQRAIALAQTLLDTQPTQTALHGDLHPDNVILTATGPVVIDAKGYIGDPAFELANAIRHPKGMPDLVRRADQIDRCLAFYADAMNVSVKRLNQWAVAKCALSIFWRSDGTIARDKEADLLHLLLKRADQ
ncbi:aminoglycoside phosphotransferase family protein [Ruegeria sp.]|uniref:aminoglycoside phosphotransferase family protein n=1 Tax=Ruegeria sp. TaxID=1879320 RepID=UPI00230891E0|nr:aminoglycoside phosphotransferase family protein [Ruegeria sp.]MDA7966967.1 phosphotransferase [Ruegeria sp.]